MLKSNDRIKLLLEKQNVVFNDQQWAAVTHEAGPAIVLAVAGAGKTTVMCARIARLIILGDTSGEKIRNVTFSKAAALDMQHRFTTLFQQLEGGRHVSFSTIHSLAYNIVRSAYRGSGQSFVLIEDRKQRMYKPRILRAIYLDVNKNYPGEEDMDELTQKISLSKNRLMSWEEVSAVSTAVPGFLEIFRRYEGYKKANGWLDYDDLLTRAYELLLEDPVLLKTLQQKHTHWQVDEFQDTSLVQWKLVKLLAAPANNLFCVGDDDQMIYGFRGSTPDLMLNFSNELPGARVFFMEENHRCAPQVVGLSSAIVERNRTRYGKKAFTHRQEPSLVRINRVKNLEQQVECVVEEIRDGKWGKGHTIGLLYRNNVSAIPFVDKLMKEGIRFRLRDKKTNLVSHWITQDLLGIIGVAHQPEDVTLFQQHYYKMNGYISKTMVQWLNANPPPPGKKAVDHLLTSPLVREAYQVKALRELGNNLKSLRKQQGRHLIPFIHDILGYGLYLDRKQGIAREMSHQLMDILAYLSSGLSAPLELSRKLESLGEGRGCEDSNLTLTTIHSAKGLEFDRVMMVDVVGGIFPATSSEKAMEKYKDLSLMEEERRLFYVGLTRSRNDVSVYTPCYSFGNNYPESRFIHEMESAGKAYLAKARSLQPGDSVRHHTFGEGEVVSVRDDSVEIRFGQQAKHIAADFLGKVLNLISR